MFFPTQTIFPTEHVYIELYCLAEHHGHYISIKLTPRNLPKCQRDTLYNYGMTLYHKILYFWACGVYLETVENKTFLPPFLLQG